MVIDPLLSYADVAFMLGMSSPWVRKQRMWRLAGLPHVLTVDAIVIGSRPRFLRAEIQAWIEAQRLAPSTEKNDYQ